MSTSFAFVRHYFLLMYSSFLGAIIFPLMLAFFAQTFFFFLAASQPFSREYFSRGRTAAAKPTQGGVLKHRPGNVKAWAGDEFLPILLSLSCIPTNHTYTGRGYGDGLLNLNSPEMLRKTEPVAALHKAETPDEREKKSLVLFNPAAISNLVKLLHLQTSVPNAEISQGRSSWILRPFGPRA